MKTNAYYDAIIESLEGKTHELQDIPSDRLDWAGPGAVLELYDKASKNDRGSIIDAIEQIVKDDKLSPVLVAQTVYIAACLDIAQIEESVQCLQDSSRASMHPALRDAVANYLAFRHLR